MSKFRIGQRVRKARGEGNIGHEGVVFGTAVVLSGTRICGVHGNALVTRDSDIQVRYSNDWVSLTGHTWPAAQVAYGRADDYDPILPSGHRSGDYSYTELMDRLKAGEGVPA